MFKKNCGEWLIYLDGTWISSNCLCNSEKLNYGSVNSKIGCCLKNQQREMYIVPILSIEAELLEAEIHFLRENHQTFCGEIFVFPQKTHITKKLIFKVRDDIMMINLSNFKLFH